MQVKIRMADCFLQDINEAAITQKNELKLTQQETTSSPPKKRVKEEKNV
jgi:hypothetical protein